jgi:hypothetical protein
LVDAEIIANEYKAVEHGPLWNKQKEIKNNG